MRKFLAFVVLFLAFSLIFVFADNRYRQADLEKSPGKFDPAVYMRDMQERFEWLQREAAILSDRSVVMVAVSEKEITAIDSYKCETCSQDVRKKIVRVGLVKPLEVMFERGEKRKTADGGFVWTIALESKTATALRIHFTHVNLPDNAMLYIYNASGEAFGPYRGLGPGNSGDFWSHTVSGPIAYVQLHHYGSENIRRNPFRISGLGYLGQKFLIPFLQKAPAERENLGTVLEHCSYNEPCVVDASCYSGSAINDAKYAVAHIQWVSGVWLYYCSGGLVADTVPSSQIPYFLTANHCISKSKDANNLECYWQYWTANCGGACYDPVGAVPRTLGATVLKTNKSGDYTLMQLKENPPSGSVFMGWTSQPVAFSDNTELFRISHPSGAPQAYSKHQVDVNAGTCTSWPRGSWIYSRDTIGATEGGSSGSPVYNLSGQIVGQLSGACGYNVNDPCDSVSNATVDGAFASYFEDVKQWLDPGDTNQTPVADFTYSIADLTVTFTDLSSDPDGSIGAWNWDFGDGNTSTQQNPVHTYAAFGTYPVTLTVTDNDGATDSMTKDIHLGGQEPDMFVYDITQTITRKGVNYLSNAVVTIQDVNNNPVGNATVTISWSGVVSGTESAVTGSNGTVTFNSSKVKSTGPFTITVTNVTHPNRPYDPALNNETTDTAYY